MILKVPVAEGSTDHLKAQLMRVHKGLPPSQSNLHNKQQSQSLKIHHHRAALALTVSPQMRRKSPQRKGWRNFHHPLIPRRNMSQSPPHSKGRHLKSQSRTCTPKWSNDQWSWSRSQSRDIRCRCHQRTRSSSYSRSQGSTSHLKRSRRSCLKDRQSPHRRRESSSPSPDRSRSRSRFQGRSRYSYHSGSCSPSRRQSSQHHQQSHSPEHSVESIHAHQTPGEDVNCIRSSIWAKFKIQFDMELEMSLIIKTLMFIQYCSF